MRGVIEWRPLRGVFCIVRLRSSPQEPHDGVSDRCGCLPLREMTDAIEHDTLVTRAEEALFALGGGGVVARIAAAVDDQGRNVDGLVPRKLRFQIVASGSFGANPHRTR